MGAPAFRTAKETVSSLETTWGVVRDCSTPEAPGPASARMARRVGRAVAGLCVGNENKREREGRVWRGRCEKKGNPGGFTRGGHLRPKLFIFARYGIIH